MDKHGVAQHIWPQGEVDCLRPVGTCVKQLLVHALQEVTDGLLRDAVLEVHVHAAKGELLSRVMTCLSEGIVVESPVVAVVVEDFHSLFGRVLLKGKLGSKYICQQIVKFLSRCQIVSRLILYFCR